MKTWRNQNDPKTSNEITGSPIFTRCEKLKKITFSNVVDNPDEAEIIKLGEIMAELDQDGTLLDGVIITSQSRVTKN